MKSIYTRIQSLYYISILLLLNGCAYNKETANPKEAVCTDSIKNVSFAKEITPILTANCTTSGCHSGSNPQSNLNLEAAKAYAYLTKKGSGYVDTLNPSGSVLYSSLTSVSSPMPPNGKLSTCDLKRIQVWMKEGAKNN